jgi:hypothetical protein
MTTNDVPKETIAEFGRKYLWWKLPGGQPHSDERIIAQTMNLGTYDDILLLEQTVGKARLVETMLNAEPGDGPGLKREGRRRAADLRVTCRAASPGSARSFRADSNG